MTAEISEEQRDRALTTPSLPGAEPGCRALLASVWCFGAAALAGGLLLTAFDLANERGLHFAVYAAACFVLAGFAAGLIALRAMFASSQKFYQRGQLDGWMRGWRGQPPEVDDPLLR